MTKAKLLIIGAGEHGRSVAEAAELGGEFEIIGFLDDSVPIRQVIFEYSVLGTTSNLLPYLEMCSHAIVAIGNNHRRETLTTQLIETGINLATIVHPKAFLSPRALINQGCAVMAGAIVGTEAQLGTGSIVNCGAVVDHHAKVGNFGHLGVNACMAGGSVLGSKAWMQAGCSLGYGIVVPDGMTMLPGTSL